MCSNKQAGLAYILYTTEKFKNKSIMTILLKIVFDIYRCQIYAHILIRTNGQIYAYTNN